MIKKSLLFLIMLLVVFCGGCWNYRGLNEMSIVSGFAFDLDKETGLYKVTFQIVDLIGNVEVEGINAKILESEGKTLFDACRNAKKSIVGKLYFGHTQLVVISEELAREKDLRNLIDWMLHDSEIRETLNLVVSTEKTAADIVKYETLVGPISAYDVGKVIEDDNDVTSSTSNKQLYEIYNDLESEGIELTLPAIRNFYNNSEYTAELNGTAVFKGERLVGYLTPDESKYFLFAVDNVKGGLLTFPAFGEGQDNVTLEISDNKTSRSFSYKDGKLVITLEPETDVFLAECAVQVDAMDKQQIEELENNASKALADRMVQTIQNVQSKFGSDIFGFGSFIHQRDNALWKKLSKDWNTIFPTLEVQVKAKVTIINTACIKE
jgi:spore germination protein KC